MDSIVTFSNNNINYNNDCVTSSTVSSEDQKLQQQQQSPLLCNTTKQQQQQQQQKYNYYYNKYQQLSLSSLLSSIIKQKNNNKIQQFICIRRTLIICICLTCISMFVSYCCHRIIAYQQNTKTLVKAPMNNIIRVCTRPNYTTIGDVLFNNNINNNENNITNYNENNNLNATSHNNINNTTTTTAATASAAVTITKPNICMVTLTDSSNADCIQRLLRWRNFDNILQITWNNKLNYCNRYGYILFDGSSLLDVSRPPSWSKIRAVQYLMDNNNKYNCDWIFWIDADTVIMNSTIQIENILPASNNIDLVLTHQKGTSWNAGAWMIRNSMWSRQFLQTWWDMKEYVRMKGQAASGDNDALKVLLQNMDINEYNTHIVTPPRCQFNSVAKFYTPDIATTLFTNIQQQQNLLFRTDYYHKGDFIAHVAGINSKIETTKMLLADAQ